MYSLFQRENNIYVECTKEKMKKDNVIYTILLVIKRTQVYKKNVIRFKKFFRGNIFCYNDLYFN